MTTQQLYAFDVLQRRWLRHQELRSTGAPLDLLMRSRLALDEARRVAHRTR